MKQNYYFKCNNCDYTSDNKFFICPKCSEGTGEKIDIKKKLPFEKKLEKKDMKNILDYDDTNLDEFYDTNFKEINECLGGGIAKSSLILLSGAPGVGKSTLLLEIIDNLSKHNKCAYITAEETALQVKKRYKRLNLKNNFKLEHLTKLNTIKEKTLDQDIIFIDSINTIYNEEDTGVLGGTSQVKSIIFSLLDYSKEYNKTIVLIAQIVKDGSISGPKTLEHMVDVVLYFDNFGENGNFRILKNIKNRFANTDNIAILEMKENNLLPINDYSKIFLNKNDITEGTAYSVFFESSKPIFVEIQSLLVDTKSEKNIIQIVGYDLKRLYQLTAILQKYGHINVYGKNIFLSISNGLKINDTSIDLGIYAAVLSHEKKVKLEDTLFIGEIGLNGNIIKKPNEEFIVKECKKYFKKIICYTNGYKNLNDINKYFKIDN